MSRLLAGEDAVELLFDLAFIGLGCDCDLFDEKGARGVEHLSFAEGKFLVAFETLEIPEYFCDLEDRTCLDLFHVFAVTAVPGLAFYGDFTALEDLEDLIDLVGADEFA